MCVRLSMTAPYAMVALVAFLGSPTTQASPRAAVEHPRGCESHSEVCDAGLSLLQKKAAKVHTVDRAQKTPRPADLAWLSLLQKKAAKVHTVDRAQKTPRPADLAWLSLLQTKAA